jgi:exodeoxyribonuclease VIII
MESNFIKSANIQPFNGTDEEYHATKDHVSASALKKIKISPAHYIEDCESEDEETDAMIFGSAYHVFILEPEKFEDEYYIFNDHDICEKLSGEGFKKPRATKEYKEWEESQMRVMADKKVITKDIYNHLVGMREKIMRHPYAKMLLSNGVNEQGYMGEIETESGNIKIKFKPDHVNENRKIIVDLKTTRDASKEKFPGIAGNLSYHIQGALYADLMEKVTGDNRAYKFIFIAQEKKKPYAFNIFEASPQFIAQGRYEYELLLQLYKYCLDNSTWPGYQVWCENKYGILELKLPAWAIKDITYYDHFSTNQKQLKS